uniref:Alpha-type protein kinase domain-containing protein n=1 Tax=Entomoneis paludosa TaxID=265537 RepID=A0A7S2VA96_9STRA|mmetsp:Transcript_10530/g.21660  ORF Transcript_10530/g.21660 Transcript_10530/m.21660 type:complete len:756 (+) Transcript_10530:274-2541(+)
MATEKLTLEKLIQKAASKLVAEEDVWSKYNIPSIPAELVVRHLYNPVTEKWETDETIVKIEKETFAHGAMRHCFRMKKMATPPASSSNHRFHRHGWSRASNYVAKAYMIHKDVGDDGGGESVQVDCSNLAKEAVQNDIILQYEAMHWAHKFNDLHPPRTIVFLRAYAIEFPNRPEQPWMAVERFIAGTDDYGAGFVKHNTNSGFVDREERRKTPQVFSAFSFYASHGTRLVADIQGVGDLYTDPQVLSSDYRFGDGDLGHRGMALFFHSFRHCSLSDLLGIPTFPLSKNELKHQAKYRDEDLTVSDDEYEDNEDRIEKERASLLRMDMNRLRRSKMLSGPIGMSIGGSVNSSSLLPVVPESQDTARRSNLTHQQMRSTVRSSMIKQSAKPKFSRTKSDVDEVSISLMMALKDAVFDHRAFHRKASGEIRERRSESDAKDHTAHVRVAPPMVPNDETKANLGKVHFHLACLHGADRFLDMETESDDDGCDVNSIVFHLAHACSLRNTAACLALGRVRAGLGSCVSPKLDMVVPIDFDSAKDLLLRCIESAQEGPTTSPAKTRAAAGCVMLQILHEEEGTTDVTLQNLLEDVLELIRQTEKEEQELKAHNERLKRGGALHVGDRVEGNYCMEGTFYPGVVTAIEGDNFTVTYDDDGSSETLPADSVRPLIPPTATATKSNVFGEGMSESEALGFKNEDEDCLVEVYTLQAELAEIKAKLGFNEEASSLFEQAADGAMNAGKMKAASDWSMKASELAA